MNASPWALSALTGLIVLSGCSILPLYANRNVSKADHEFLQVDHNAEVPSGAVVASGHVPWRLDWRCRNALTVSLETQTFQTRDGCPQDDTNLVAVAISGGGSRAAVFSAQVLFELQRYGLLQQVDVLSSVSGGSYTAAFYVLSCDDPARNCPDTVEGPGRFAWREDAVFELLQRNYVRRWVLNWLWPENVVRYRLTDYDRTDIMAETLSDNLFDNSQLGNEGFRFRDLNPQRPNLIINATNNTADALSCGDNPAADRLAFTFTQETFDCLYSDLGRFPVAYAVTASAAFPGAFNYVTLGNYALDTTSTSPRRYVHLFDGGTSDNLGLTPLRRMVRAAGAGREPGTDALVILIDAYVPSATESGLDDEPRKGLDYVLDTNFLAAYDTLMERMRKDSVCGMRQLLGSRDALAHVTFELLNPARDRTLCEGSLVFEPTPSDAELYGVVSTIGTNLKIGCGQAACLRTAAIRIMGRLMPLLRQAHPSLAIRAQPEPPPDDAPRAACAAYIAERNAAPPPDIR